LRFERNSRDFVRLLLTPSVGPSVRLALNGVALVWRIRRVGLVRFSSIRLAAWMMAAFSLDAVEFFLESNVEIFVPSPGLPSIAQRPAFGGRHVDLLLDAN